jgi:hypothetical protein
MSNSLITRTLLFVATITIVSTVAAENIQAQGRGNPVIWDGGKQITGVTYDPFSGRIRVKTDHRKVRESVLDPNRTYVDPGSYQRVDEYQTDAQGNRWHVTGYRWTSYGVPHGNLNRQRVSNIGGGIDHEENENVVYSPGSTSGQPKGTQNKVKQPRTSVKKPVWGGQPRRITQPFKPAVKKSSFPVHRGTQTRQAYNPF